MEFGNPQATQSRRLIGIVAVVAFHVLLVWALVSGLARKVIEVLPVPVETRMIEEVKPPEDIPPPPPPPELDVPPPPFVPLPEVVIETPPPRPTAIVAQSEVPTPPPAPPAPVVKAPPSVSLKIDRRRCRLPDYPSASQRLGESGSVVLQLLVGVDGKVSDSRIAVSSGYARLDNAARKALSLCKFDPAVVDGAPVAAWGSLKYTFVPYD